MRLMKIVFALALALGLAAGVRAGEKETPRPGDEKPADQTGSVSGAIHPPSKEAPNGTTAELHQPAGAGKESVVFYLFADGKEARTLKDLAKNGGSATVTGVVTEKGYRVTSVQKGK